MLVRARTLAGRPIPDALIVAAAIGVDAVALATFDRGQARYGFPVVVPSAAARPWAARSQRVGASGPCSPIQSGTGR